MKKTLLFKSLSGIAILAILFLSFYDAFTYSTSVPPANTTANSSNCGSCHGSGSSTKNITVTGIPSTGYKNDSTYTMTISAKISQKVAGFELTVLNKSKKIYGTLAIGSFSGIKKLSFSSIDYIAHSKPQSASSGSVSWKFTWKAPKTGSDTITFYTIVNDANNDGSSSGDKIIYQVFTFYPITSTGTAPTAAIKVSKTSVCQGDSIQLSDASTGSPTSWKWSSSLTGKTFTTQNPTVLYNGVNGTDSITLISTNSNGSSKAAVQVITVNSLPSKDITLNGSIATSSSICSGDSIKLSASTGSSYSWSSGQTTQDVYIKSASSYTVKVTNSAGCSVTSNAFNLTVNKRPSPPFFVLNKGTFCDKDSIKGSASTSNAKDTIKIYDSTKKVLYYGVSNKKFNYFKIADINGSNSFYGISIDATNGCKSIENASKPVIYPLPKTSFTYTWPNKTNNTIQFTNNSKGASTYTWSFGDKTSSILSAPSHTYPNRTTSYRVKLSSLSVNGCSSSDSLTIGWTGLESFQQNDLGLKLYPNPSNGQITISSNQNELLNVIILSLDGKVETTLGNVNTNQVIDITELKAGFYYLKAFNTKGISVISFIKN